MKKDSKTKLSRTHSYSKTEQDQTVKQQEPTTTHRKERTLITKDTHTETTHIQQPSNQHDDKERTTDITNEGHKQRTTTTK